MAYGYSDEETALQIQENPYLQYFCGYPGYDDEKLPFDPSLMVYFRKRLTPEVGQLFSNGFAGHLGSMLAASGVFQVILPGTLAVGAGLLPICGIMENIQKLFGVLSGLVEQGNVLGIPNIGGRTGGIYNHGAAVTTLARIMIRVIIIF